MSEFQKTELMTGGAEPPLGSPISSEACLPVHVSNVKPGEAVFQIGDPKDIIFRIESGTIGISGVLPSGSRELIEEIGSGTVFGLGFLDEHVFDAIALAKSVVSAWSKTALPILEVLHPAVKQRHALETEREFLHRRRTLVASAPKTPHQHLAGFLCVASRLNVSEGRDPRLIDESVDCASVAAFLRMDMDTLAQALLELRKRGLIVHEPPRGVRLIHLEALQALVSEEDCLAQGLVT